MNEATRQAQRAHDSDWLDAMASAGLVALGVVHLLIGWLAVQLALGDREGSASSTGALHQLAEQPFGTVLVWLVGIGLVLLVVWQAIEAVVGHRDADDRMKRLRKRATSAGKAVVYAVVAVSAVRVATGSGSGGGGTDSTTSTLMDRPGGQLLVGAVAVGIAVVAVVFLVRAWTGSFLEKLSGEGRSGDSGTAYRWWGRAGYAAKGVALLVVAGLFGYAAISHEPDKSGGIDQALRTVLDQPFGPLLLLVIGLGFAAYGLFCFAQARHLDR